MQVDPEQLSPIEDLVQEDYPEDSFVPLNLKAEHKHKTHVQIVPGINNDDVERIEFEVE